VIGDPRRKHGVGRGFADEDALGDRFRGRVEGGDRRVVGTLDRVAPRRELVEGDDVRGTDDRRFGRCAGSRLGFRSEGPVGPVEHCVQRVEHRQLGNRGADLRS
jgi:hypothetical protein